jgi:hypothetical protein
MEIIPYHKDDPEAKVNSHQAYTCAKKKLSRARLELAALGFLLLRAVIHDDMRPT